MLFITLVIICTFPNKIYSRKEVERMPYFSSFKIKKIKNPLFFKVQQQKFLILNFFKNMSPNWLLYEL